MADGYISAVQLPGDNTYDIKDKNAVTEIQINGTAQTKTDGVVNLPAYPSDTKVTQGNTTTNNWRHIILGYNSWSATEPSTDNVTAQVYRNNNLKISPGYGQLYLKGSSPQLSLVDNTFDLTQSNNGVSAEKWRALRFRDKNENNISLFINSVNTNATSSQIWTYNKSTDGTTDYSAYLALSVYKSGDKYFFTSSDVYWRLSSSEIDRDGTVPNSKITGKNLIQFVDKNNENIGRISIAQDTNGNTEFQLINHNENTSGTEVYNIIKLITAKDGTCSYYVSDGAAFRTAIGAGTSNLEIGTTATTAMAGNTTFPTTIATDSGTNQLTLAASTKYKLTAGGTSYIFTTPPNTNTTYSLSRNNKEIVLTGSDNSTSSVDVARAVLLTNEDLNAVVLPGFYNAGGGNSCTNTPNPSSASGFGLIVLQTGSGAWYYQVLTYCGTTTTYRRARNGSSGVWTDWIEEKVTDTTYSAGTGLSLSGTTFNHSNSVTAGTAKGDDSKTLTFDGTFTIPTVTYDTQGHITGKGTTTMTMPSNPNTDEKVKQSLDTEAKNFPLLFSKAETSNTTTDITNWTYRNNNIYVKPSTKQMFVDGSTGDYYKKGRDSASFVKSVTPTSYSAVIDVKSINGDWSLGTLGGSSPTERLYFVYTTDTNYSGSGNKALKYYLEGTDSTSSYAILHSGNYNSYAPTLTGTGASGDWGINITGNATTATTASKLSNTSKIGDTTKPVYFTANGVPSACSYSLNATVPSDAVFTDTWTALTGATSSANGTVGYINAVPPKNGYNTKYFRADGTWSIPDFSKITGWTTNTPTVVTKKTVVTDATMTSITVSGITLEVTNGSVARGDSVTVTAGTAATLTYT